mmetsp:Transcript_152085/g.488328  ORF Transcript_152085/g.488328 Transcript_152085/m.488328 type:complete len:291 (-) Transcript_152085:171-1043(-)
MLPHQNPRLTTFVVLPPLKFKGEHILRPTLQKPAQARVIVRREHLRFPRLHDPIHGRAEHLAPVPVPQQLENEGPRLGKVHLSLVDAVVVPRTSHQHRVVVVPGAYDVVVAEIQATQIFLKRQLVPSYRPPLPMDMEPYPVPVPRPTGLAARASEGIWRESRNGSSVGGFKSGTAVQKPAFALQSGVRPAHESAFGCSWIIRMQHSALVTIQYDVKPLPPVQSQRDSRTPHTCHLLLHALRLPPIEGPSDAVPTSRKLMLLQISTASEVSWPHAMTWQFVPPKLWFVMPV